MKRIRYDCKTNAQWREERSHSVGASAIGTILGENPFQTPYELCVRMREELNGNFDYSQNMAMLRGHAYESGVAYLFENATGLPIIKSSSSEYVVRRDDMPFLHASPDRTYWIDPDGPRYGKVSNRNKGILECKTTRRPVDPGNLPLSWIFQLQVQLGITGYREGYIAWDVLSIPDGFGYARFDFDKELFNAAVDVARSFWDDCVIGGKNPDPVSASDMVKMYPEPIEGKSITAINPSDIVELKEMMAAQKELEAAIIEKKNIVATMFGDAEAIVDIEGNVLATYKAKAGATRLDSKSLKADHPDIYSQYASQTASTRILLIK